MRAPLLACCLGLSLPALFPGLSCVPVASLLALFGTGLSLRYLEIRKCMLYACLLAFCLGLAWHWLWASQRLSSVIDPHLEGVDVMITGRVLSLPVATETGQRFIFEVLESEAWHPEELPVRLQLSTFAPEEGASLEVQSGERWQWLVRLKRPHGYANPGGRDSEAYMLRNNIAATGYVRNSESNTRLDGQIATLSVAGMRAILERHLDGLLARHRHRELMLALLMGEQSRISPQRWQLFSDTGTNHLFVISGLHIGLVAMVSFTLGWRALAVLWGPSLRWPAQQLAAFAAMLASSGYALMAGFTLPTQRALVMVLVFLSAYLSGRRLSLSLRYCLALNLVLLLDPLATTSAGFWLSFMAVGVLILFAAPTLCLKEEMSATDRLLSKLKQSWRAQWVVFAGLLLPMLFWMGQVSLIAPLVNLVAIPLVGVLLVPLLLLALVVAVINEAAAGSILELCDRLLSMLLYLLDIAAGLGNSLQFELVFPGLSSYLFLLLAIGLALLPRGTPGRYLALPFCLPLLLPALEKPRQGELWVDVFDVGQGLSVLLRTRDHSLLYDTGAGRPPGWTAAAAIVIPALRRLGVYRLDSLLVSHGDNDHAGGMDVMLDTYPEASLLANRDGSRCQAGDRWYWNEVSFEILHPQQTGATSNNDSCVLRVQAGNQAVLLPGDIEAAVEWDLALKFGGRLHSSLLIAPHHGSASSSSYPFIKVVNPQQVVFSTGYRNGFSHPAAQVEARYREWGIASYNTADCGMLSFRLGSKAAAAEPGVYRHRHRKYWSWSGNSWSCRYL